MKENKLSFAIIHCLCWVKYKIPYNRAKLHMAYEKYKETTLYEDRVSAMDKKFAMEAFIDRDSKFFLGKLTRSDKIKAFIAPFSHINKNTVL